jgi:uncharacterized protein
MDLPSAPLSDLPMPAENAAAAARASASKGDSKRLPRIVVMAILFEGGLGLLAIMIGLFMSVPPWHELKAGPMEIGYGFAATVPMLAGLLALRAVHAGPLGRLNSVVDQLVAPLFGKCSIFQLAMISVVAGVGEELLFRGVVQPLLIGWIEILAGVLAASVIFGLMHAITPTYAILATAVGAYLGWLTLATGGLVAPIIAHSLYDFLALVYLTKSQRVLEN